MSLWFDADDLFDFAAKSARPTGIQRLTGEAYIALVERYPDEIRFVRHAARPGLFDLVEWDVVRATYQQLTAGTSERGAGDQSTGATGRQASFIDKMMNALFRRGLGRNDVQSKAGDRPTIDLRDVAKPGDVLCALGAPWHDAHYQDRVTEFKAVTGASYAMLVHDLIPLVRPEYFEAGRAPYFAKVVAGTLPLADAIFTNSKATARDVSTWAAQHGIDLRRQPRPIPIGMGFNKRTAGPLPRGLDAGNFVLFVSTIEVRKNHLQAFHVWCRLLRELPPEQVPTLVFAGGWGWMVDDLRKAIESTNYLNGKLVVISSPDDATLSALYQNCRFTLFLSHYEGWGLPVSDSLSFGKICIASNRASMPEAGGEFCLYVDPDNTTEAYETIRAVIEDPRELTELEHALKSAHQPTAWSATADSIFETLTSLSETSLVSSENAAAPAPESLAGVSRVP